MKQYAEDVQFKIEALTHDFSNPEGVYARYPILMDKLIKKEKLSAKEFLLSKRLNNTERTRINSFSKYQLELVIIRVLSLLFNEVEESTMTKMSTFVEQFANYVRFEIDVIAKRKLDIERRLEEKRTLREEQQDKNALADHIDSVDRVSDFTSGDHDAVGGREYTATLLDPRVDKPIKTIKKKESFV